MPRSSDDSPRRRRKDRYRSEERSRSSSRGRRDSRERDRQRHKKSHSRRRSISNDHKKSYDRSPTSYQNSSSHRSKHRSTSRHRSRSDYKKSRHRRERSSSVSSSSSSNSSSSRSKPRSLKRSSSSDEVKLIEPTISKNINLDSANNDEKRRQLIEEIDAENFVPKTFSSSSNKKISDKVIIDLQKETISIPKFEIVNPVEDEIIHPNLLGNDEERMEKWIRKLFVYRQKHYDE